MKNRVFLAFFIWALQQMHGEFIFAFAQSELSGDVPIEVEFESKDEFTKETPIYDRIDEVEKKCKSVLSSSSQFNPDRSRFYGLKQQLQFENGDWSQDGGEYPIMPFNSINVGVGTPLKLISFRVVDIDLAHQSKKSVSVSGFLTMGITLDGTFEHRASEHPHFNFWPGHSELSVAFQGIYTESKKNGGERVMCLLGTGLLPSRDQESSDPWSWAKASDVNRHQLPLLQDDQILLVLRYPMQFTLMNRAIRGEMRSLNPKSNLKYFDDIHVSSQLGKLTNYEFVAENFVSKACVPYPYNDSFMHEGISMYRGLSFCRILEEITQQQALTIVPNWRCNVSDSFCRQLGPFPSDKDINKTDGSFKDVKLYMQNVKCKLQASSKNGNSARVSAVFRAVSPSENLYVASRRSGLSNATMVSEGIWKSSSGQLCMVCCLGLDVEQSLCDSRICLYIPISFTIQQRSIIVGSISSISNKSSHFPLSFEKLFQPMELWNYFRDSHPFYNYTKIASAGAVLEKNEPFSFRTVIKKSLLRYPKLEDSESYEISISLLLEDLTLHTPAVLNPLHGSQTSRTDIQMEIISVNSYFGRYWSNATIPDAENPYHVRPEYTEKQLLLNVSAQLLLNGPVYSNFSVLFLEGIYDPHVGQMYLVGCRDVRASWNVLYESMDLEDGLDCQIEVVVSYPATTAQWLINPTAGISISSQRTEDDTLYFSQIKLETLPIMYRRQRQDILSRKSVEGVLEVLTLSLAVACIYSQISYINHNLEFVPYISLIMLGIQTLGYTLPLVTGAEALFKRGHSESYEYSSYDLENNLWFLVIDYTVKLLIVISLLLTLRLCQKVWKSRLKLLRQAPLEPHRVPSDKWVLIGTLIIHLIGYVTVLVIHISRTTQLRVKSYMIPEQNSTSHMLQGWERDLKEYAGLVQDFFLLPQVIGNLLWQIDCKPLRKFYFIGITLVRLLPHIYDYIRAPTVNPYFVENRDYEFVNPSMDFYSKFGDIAIPLTAFILAVVVYIQQRWNYEKLSQALVLRQVRLLPRASRMYERLPSKSFEAELASASNGNAKNEEHGDVE